MNFWGYMKEGRILETSEQCSPEGMRFQIAATINPGAMPNSLSTKTALERSRSARISYNPWHES